MDAAGILSQIRPCDQDNPYIFISYSANDHLLVWEDALMFQRLGYNVWLDERNLDKTKASWTDDALEAISDLDCMLLLFYVSGSSLTSEPCYRELKQTVDTQTMRIHFGPVHFIAVDAENVGDISRFTHQLHSDLMHRKDISKQEKTNRAIILSQFCDEFFALNNERVRIHPKSEPNRKSNYYADILSAFPDEARLYEPTITLEALYGHAEPAKPEEPAPPEETAVQNADESAAEDKSTAAAAPQEESSSDAAKAALPETPAEPKEAAPDLTDQIAALLKRKRSETEEEAAPAEETASASSEEAQAPSPEEPASPQPAPEEDGTPTDAQTVSDALLADQITALLARRTDAAKADEAGESASQEAPAPTPEPPARPLTLEERLRQYMADKEKQ